MWKFAASLTIIAALAGPLRAQPAEPAPDAPAEPAEPAAPPQASEDPAELVAVYDQAFRAMLAGDLEKARVLFRDVASRSVETERAAAAREMARLADELSSRGARIQLQTPAATPSAERLPRRVSPDDEPDAGRTGFIITTTFAATYAGVVLIDVSDIDDLRPGVVMVTGATAAGLLGSLYGSRGQTITAGMADSYSMGMLLGAGNALLLFTPVGLDGSSEAVQGTVLTSLAVGGAVGMAVASSTRPTRAQVGFVGTTATLGIATVGLGLATVQPDVDEDTVLLLLAGGLDVGAGVGMGISPKLRWSHSRGRLVSLGLFVGALAGWGGAALITGADVDSDVGRVWSTATLVGMWSGFGLAMHLTRDMKEDARYAETPVAGQTRVLPTTIRGAPGLAAVGTF